MKRSILRIKEYFGKKRIERRRHMTEWIITCNINVYNVEGAFDKLDTIDWKQSTYVEKGDIVYIYVGAPMSAIRYKCEAMEVELPEATIDDSEFVLDGSSYENYGRYMRLHLLDKYDNPLLGRSKLIENGLKTVQGPSKVNSQLSAYLFSVVETGGNVFDHFYDKKGIAPKTRREAITILQRAYNRPLTARELTDIMYEIDKQQANVHAELTFMEQQRLVIKSGSSAPYGYSVVSNVGTPQYFYVFQNQSFGEESKGEYLQALKQAKDGTENHHWSRLKEVKKGAAGMENEKGIVKLTRKQLYDEIWALSVAGVARKYNLNYGKLIATCKVENIPFPSSGYWTKKNMGKDVSNEAVELSGHEETEISLITNDAVVKRIRKAKAEVVEKVHTDVTEELDVVTEEDLPQKKTDNIPEWPDGILDYLDETERNKVLEYACNLQISQSTRLHKMLVQYKKDIADYKSKLKEVQSRPYYNSRHNKPENEPEFFKEMSDECMSRAIAILDTVFKTIESLGGSINSDLSVKIRGDIVRFCMVESQDQVKHEMTKQEAQALVKYNDDIKNHRWVSKPQIRKYDKVYNGKLRIVFGARSYIRDNDSEKLEDRLGDILVTLYEKAEENRIVREAREEAERKRVEEERRREENRQRKEQEIRLVKELVNKAEDYRIAKEIREYIQAMIDSGNEDITPEWIEWALKKADWYDPSIATEDEYLGKRQHEKSAEEKEKSLQDSIRKSWYW